LTGDFTSDPALAGLGMAITFMTCLLFPDCVNYNNKDGIAAKRK
jgi:hypothetical protein